MIIYHISVFSSLHFFKNLLSNVEMRATIPELKTQGLRLWVQIYRVCRLIDAAIAACGIAVYGAASAFCSCQCFCIWICWCSCSWSALTAADVNDTINKTGSNIVSTFSILLTCCFSIQFSLEISSLNTHRYKGKLDNRKQVNSNGTVIKK